MKLFKIGDQWYRLEGMQLSKVEAPENEPAEGEFFDGSKLVKEFDEIGTLEAVAKKANELIEDYNRLRTEAASNPGKLPQAREAQELAAVATLLHGERKAALGELAEAATLPNEPAPDAEEDDNDGDAEADDGGEETTTEETTTEETVEVEVEVPDDASQLTGELLANVAAAMTTAGADPAQVLSALTPGRRNGQAPTAPEAPAAVVVAGAHTGIPGKAMSFDDIANAHQNWARGVKRGRTPASMTIGTIQQFGETPAMIASSETVDAAGGKLDAGAAADFHARRAGSRGITAAAPDRCGPTDVRREIKYAGDDSSPLLGILESYPSPHCELEYYRDITLADVATGVGVWDSTARTAYQDALDAWRASMTATNLAALKAAEKLCVIAGCPPTDTVDMLPIYACLEYPTDLEYCSPQAIRAYWRALNRAYVRERSSNFLAVLATKSARITVDASDAFFTSAVPIYDGTNITNTIVAQLGATAVIDYVMSSMLGLGVMQERITDGNYTAVIPYGLQKLLELDGRLAEAQQTIAQALGVSRVITSMDVATGSSIPWSAAPDQDGTTEDFITSYKPPTDWDIAVFDPDDWFAISRPDIEVGAQITPETIRGNMAFGGFMESFEGYGKDGAHPSYTIALSNLVYNGARPARINPAGLLA